MPTSQKFLYLSRADVVTAAIDPAVARDAIITAFADTRTASLPKQALQFGPGHAFQAMVSSSASQNVATIKWLCMADGALHALICVNDIKSGALLAVMDGDQITLIRTAAMSAAAAHFLAPAAPRVLGFIGCGAQAHAHLATFRALYASVEHVYAYSRGATSAAALVAEAARHGLAGKTLPAEAVVRQSDVLVTSVPASEGFRPFLDVAWLKPVSFVTAVDVGRSWNPERVSLFDIKATDSMTQAISLPSIDGNLSITTFDYDLAALAQGGSRAAAHGRALFSFKGFALGDLALATVVYERAVSQGLGTWLAR